MIKAEHTQSLTDFRANAAKTLERVNQTGDAEIITVNGRAEGVLLAPAVYDEFAREIDLAASVARIRKAMQEADNGQAEDGFKALDEIRDRLIGRAASETPGSPGTPGE